MLLKLSQVFILLLTLTTSLLAESSEDEIKKALANIQQIKIMKSSSPKIVSEVIIKNKLFKKSKKIKRKKISNIKKRHKKIKIKKIKTKRVIKRKKIKQKIDISQLQDVETFGVIKISQPFEIK